MDGRIQQFVTMVECAPFRNLEFGDMCGQITACMCVAHFLFVLAWLEKRHTDKAREKTLH